jgi:hypothetical protein
MARARNIKPGFFTNEELVELPFSTRLLFIGLWTLADRAGRLEDRPKKIKMAIFPADSVDVDAALNELQQAGFLLRYEHSGVRYIQVLAFSKHQSPHKDEKASTIPAPCEHGANTVQAPDQHGGNPPDCLIPESLSSDSGLLNEEIAPGSDAAAAPKKSRAPAKTPLPDGFCISERVRSWAVEKGYSHLERHFENFVGACKAKGYTYACWDEAFMGAIRNDWAKLNTPQARASPAKPQLDLAAAQKAANEEAKRRLFGNDDGRTIDA